MQKNALQKKQQSEKEKAKREYLGPCSSRGTCGVPIARAMSLSFRNFSSARSSSAQIVDVISQVPRGGEGLSQVHDEAGARGALRILRTDPDHFAAPEGTMLVAV